MFYFVVLSMINPGEADDDFNFRFLDEGNEVAPLGGPSSTESSFTFDFNLPQDRPSEEPLMEEYDLSSLNFHELPRMPVEMLPPTPLPGSISLRDSMSASSQRSASPSVTRPGPRRTIGEYLAAVLEANRESKSNPPLSLSSRIASEQEWAAGARTSSFGSIPGGSPGSVGERNGTSSLPPLPAAGPSSTVEELGYSQERLGSSGLSSGEGQPSGWPTSTNTGSSSSDWRGSARASPVSLDKWKSTRKPRCTFTHGEVKAFYEALSQFGTDFNLIALLFPKRDRNDLKKLYHRELKKNHQHILAALNERKRFDEAELHLRIKERQKAMTAEPLRVLEKEEEAYLREIQEESSATNAAAPLVADEPPKEKERSQKAVESHHTPVETAGDLINWEDEEFVVGAEDMEGPRWGSEHREGSGERSRPPFLSAHDLSEGIDERYPLHKRSRSDDLLVDLLPSFPLFDP